MTLFLLSLLLVGDAEAASTAPKIVLTEAQMIAGKLKTRTERSAAYLALGQAQNQLGDRKGALQSLKKGWAAFERGSDKGLTEGDAADSHTLLDRGDFSTMPIEYAYEFVAAGDVPSARQAALSLGRSDLADSYRQDLGRRLRERFPEAADRVGLTDAQRTRLLTRKRQILDGLPAVRSEADAGKRSFGLYEAAQELTRTGGNAEALGLLREAAKASNEITEPEWRAIDRAQIADALWSQGDRAGAKELLRQAEADVPAVEPGEKRLKARFSVEQTKRSMGLPNELEAISKAIGPTPAPPEETPAGVGIPPPPDSAYVLLGRPSGSAQKAIGRRPKRRCGKLRPIRRTTDGT